ncbi:MAG: hypothetical protein ABIB04_04095 [Patescibacteria group bacterium]
MKKTDIDESAILSAENGESEEKKARVNSFDSKLALAQKIINRLKDELVVLEHLLTNNADIDEAQDLINKRNISESDVLSSTSDDKILEGVFDGQGMVGSDGREYSVPPNYASKSKLVEGDILKLTIKPNGTFVFKQIGPIERQRVVGTLVKDEITGDWKVTALGKKFNVLTAAVSYHKGDAGDDAVILVPKAAPSKWAAVENVINRT